MDDTAASGPLPSIIKCLYYIGDTFIYTEMVIWNRDPFSKDHSILFDEKKRDDKR